MKLKSLAMLAASGLMAASFAYIAPAMADDASTGQAMQPAAPSSSDSALPGQGNGGASSTDATGNAQSGNGSASDSGNAPAVAPAAPSSGDDASNTGSADTATGDDDY